MKSPHTIEITCTSSRGTVRVYENGHIVVTNDWLRFEMNDGTFELRADGKLISRETLDSSGTAPEKLVSLQGHKT